MYKAFVALVISWLMTPAGVFAQTQPAHGDREVTILESVRSTALPLVWQKQPPPERSWPGRHPVLFGALVGLGAGLAIEAAVIPGASGGEPHSAYIPMFACTGAGIGALVGLIVSAARR
jgi:hypothetical protein